MPTFKPPPKKYQPRGFEILHEDRDIIVGNKAAGLLTVAALWNRTHTVQTLLNDYVRKGNAKSRNEVFVVHRLDQATTGVLVFAKSEHAQFFLKENWPATIKTYFAVVHGIPTEKSGTITSHLKEDDDYVVKSTDDETGKLARTEFEVVATAPKFSLMKINLLTGRKNQIRVHMADLGHPVVGDAKYGPSDTRHKLLALHSHSIELTHPFSKKRMTFSAKPPGYFKTLVDYAF